ncbi:MAG: flagellar biosynthesis anti-sigma factor FlgM [Bacteroidetes bacterium]|nr:flagellar biosynthesis anti-sigma factor FlgM [Bacteroidota bacterium]
MKIPGSADFFKSTISKTGAKKESKKAGAKESEISGSAKKSNQGASSAEKVLLSSKARDIARINEVVKASPDIRTERVERIKGEIANGTYSVDGKDIAEKILKEILAESAFLENYLHRSSNILIYLLDLLPKCNVIPLS